MKESILLSVKQMLGLTEDYKFFDADIITDINSVFSILSQLGVGETGFSITGENETWDEYLESDKYLNLIKTYMFMKVKMMFDIPSSGTAIEAYNKQISELEWRINAVVDPKDDNELKR